jgi:hypothetical protein
MSPSAIDDAVLPTTSAGKSAEMPVSLRSRACESCPRE